MRHVRHLVEEELVSVERRDQNLIVHVIVPHLHMYHIPEFKEAMSTVLDDQPPRVIMVLEKVDYLDSSAMGALFYVKKTVNRYGGKFCVVGINHTIAMVFKLTRSDQHLEVYDTIDEALGA